MTDSIDKTTMADRAGTHHGLDYVELSVTDIEVAKQFYGDAFGWTFTDYGPEYTGFSDGARGSREAGGLRLVEEVSLGGPLIVVYSSELEASEASVSQAGGKIVQPIFEFPGGRRFELEDPSGNRLAVWTQG